MDILPCIKEKNIYVMFQGRLALAAPRSSTGCAKRWHADYVATTSLVLIKKNI